MISQVKTSDSQDNIPLCQKQHWISHQTRFEKPMNFGQGAELLESSFPPLYRDTLEHIMNRFTETLNIIARFQKIGWFRFEK